MYLRP